MSPVNIPILSWGLFALNFSQLLPLPLQLHPGNEMDKVVKFILDSDIQIRAFDAKYNALSQDRSHMRLPGICFHNFEDSF